MDPLHSLGITEVQLAVDFKAESKSISSTGSSLWLESHQVIQFIKIGILESKTGEIHILLVRVSRHERRIWRGMLVGWI